MRFICSGRESWEGLKRQRAASLVVSFHSFFNTRTTENTNIHPEMEVFHFKMEEADPS